MAFYDSYFQNPGVFALVIGILSFIIFFEIVTKLFRMSKGVAFVSGLAIGGIISWFLYRESFYYFESALVILVYIVVALVALKILWAFVKNTKTNIGH